MLHSKSILSLLLASVALVPIAFANHEAVTKTESFKDSQYLSDVIGLSVAFSEDIDEMAATPSGEWVVISGTNVRHSTNFPSDTLAKIYEYIHMGKTIDCVAFTPKDSWMVIAEDQAWRSGPISYLTLLEEQIIGLVNNNVRCRELVFDSDNDGWALIADHYVYMKKMPREFHEAVADGGSSKRVVNRISMSFLGSFCVMAEDWYGTTAVGKELIAGLKKFQKENISLDRIMLGPSNNFVLYSNGSYVPDLTKGIKELEYRIPVGVSPSGTPLYKNIWQRMEELNIPGVSIGIVEDNKLVWARGYGEMEKGTQRFVRRNTSFDTASVSKSVGAAGILTYMDDPGTQMHLWTSVFDAATYGNPWSNPLFLWLMWLSVETDITHIPAQAMTIERLLSHSASLDPWGALAYFPGDAKPKTIGLLTGAYYDDNQQLKLGGSHKIWYNPNILGDGNSYFPGEVYRYSGGGYYVAQVMTEIFTGKPFSELLNERIFSPLNMKDSTVVQPLTQEFANHAALPHNKEGNVFPPSERAWYPWAAESGLYSSARDFAQFIITLNQKGVGPDGNQVIMPLYVKEMLKDHAPGLDKYGFGVQLSADFVNDTNSQWYTHGGAHGGANAKMAGNPTKRQGIVIFCNRGYSEARKFVDELYNTYKAVYNW
ncbi:MAG: serine hydrolase domain-containing protein [Planctomycetota bacterium]